MAFTAEEIRQEAQTFLDGAGQSLSAYLHMLDGIAKYHKYPLEQQAVLAYAPSGYTAVADRRIWEDFFHVQIEESATGVAVPDEKSPNGFKTVFDVSETEGWPDGKQPDLLWHFDAERDKGVFQGLAGENASVMDGLLQTCWNVEDVFVADSEKTGEETLLLSASVGYVLMKRLGFSREAEIHAEQTITEELLHSAKTIPLQEISDISREILNGIQDYVQKGKGRGEDFPLLNIMYRLRENYAGHEEEIQEEKKWREASQSSVEIAERQEISSVEAPVPEAADATKEAAEPKEAGASPESPAVDPATEAVASVAAENQVNRSQVDKRNFIISSKGRFIRRRSFGSAAISLSLMDDQSLEVRFLDDPNHSSFRVNSFDEAFSVSKERYSELSRPSPNPSLVAASVEGQYRDMLRLYKNREFAESDISDPAISAVLSQEESPVEAPATEATDATQEVAEPEEAGAFTETPAVDPVTEAVASVAADDSPFNIPVIVDRRRFDMSPDGLELVEFSSTPDSNTWGTQSRELPENYITVGMEYMSNGRIDVKIFDSVTEDEKVFSASSHDELIDSGRKAFSEMLPDADDADLTMLSSRLLTHSILMERRYDAAHREIHASDYNEEKEYAEFMESYAKEQQDNVSSESPAVDSATEAVTSLAAEYDSSLDDDYSRDVVDSRAYFISSDGKRSNKPKPSMLRIGVDLRDDGAAYIDIATHNRNTGAGILADDPNDAHEFALRTPLTQNFNPQVIADAILSDYQEMMQQHNISVPSVVDQRRFDVSPDGVDVMEYAYDPENDRWTSSGPSPDNHIRFDMRYMSNGRVDVGISDSVTGQTRIFKDYENLYNSARAIIADVVPDSNAAMLANWVVQHAVLMERTAKKDSQQENTSVEVAAPEAVDATQKAAWPEEAVSSAEAPAVDPATDDSSVAVDDFDNSISVEEYFKLAGVQVIPVNRSLEFMAYAKEHFANESTDFGKFVIINDPDMVTGETSFTVPGNGSDPVTYHEKPDYVLHILGVDMEAFRDALAKYDGTNLDEVALPIEHSSFKISTSDDNLIYSPFLMVGPTSDYPKEKQVQQESSNTDSVSTAEASPIIESEIKFHGGKKGEAFQRNVAAITTLKTLELNPAFPMSSEQRYALLDYSGFGNLPEVFDAKNKNWQPEHDVLEKILTREEYAAARASVLNSYYTDPAIVAAVFQGLAGMGFKKGNILEPSCGVGNFFRAMPEDIRKESHLFGVELDPISGRIARQLYPDVNISIQGFETTTYPEGSFDLAITNVPFENYKIHGYSVHDYFLLKMAQQVRPGGLMVAITSRYSMDKKDSSAREELARRAELIKAIRLPNTAFREAGAEATTDILILRRREHNLEYGDALPSWVNVVSFEDNPDIYVNPYFLQHPEDVIGSLEKKSTSYGFDLTCKPVEGKRETGEIASEIAKAMSSIRAEYVPAKNELPIPEQKQDGNAMAYSFFVDGEQVQFRDTDSYHVKSMADLGIDEKDKQQLLHLIRLRDLTREVIRVQQSGEGDEALVAAQEHMNAVYDDYAEAYGDLHAKKAKQLFEADCSYPLLLSLEQTDEKGNVIGKSDIFTKRTIRPHVPPSHVDTAQEALIVSMIEHGKVDMPYMEALTGRKGEDLSKELEYREMFWNFRDRTYQSADEYLSGDIREKMEWLEKNIEVTRILRDRDIWDSLIPPTHANDVDYVPKNETEERILDKGTSYRFTDMAHDYIKGSQDWPFFFEYLKNFDAAYHLPDTVTSDPLFVLEAGLRVGNAVDDTEGLVVLSDVVSAMNILGLEMKKQPSRYESPVLKFLAEGSEKEYPQKRACVHYLRRLLKEYDGTNARALADRAGQEWPSVWQDWKKKFDATLDKGELFGLANFNEEIERGEKNLAALKAVCPKDLTAEEISVRLGTPWVPPSDIEAFMKDIFGASEKVEYSNVNHGEWYIRSGHSRSYRFSDSRPMAKSYSTPEYDALALLELTLNLRQAVVKKTVYVNGEERQVIDQEKTVLAQQKQEMLKEAFATWVWQDESRKERLVSYYNRHFNNIRPREYDGSHLVFPGMNPEIRLRPHQKDAIAHTLYGGNTLLAHCVGAGKTFEMIASIMESKRLGLSTKAMLVVPGHLTEQTGAEFMRLYPTANILVATKKDFEKSRRKEFCAKIATHNWDAVILGFTQFEKVAMSREYIENFTRDEIDRLAAEIEVAKKQEGKSFDIRQMERLRKSMEGKLAALEDKKPKDDVIDFEALGIDRLYVDEAHNFKNLGVITKLTRLPGISTTPAQKSTDFYQKVQYLNNKTNGKGLVFATGTAISNSMTELYVMQQYLQPDRLESEGVRHFDTWATTFGEISDVQEISPEGKGLRVRQRFTKFCNLPELMSMVKEFADIKTEDMLDLPTPNVEYHVESVPASPEQKAMVDELADRAMKIRSKSVDTSLPENNMLAVTGEGRKLALDQRLMNPNLPDYPDSKVNRCVGNIFRIWQETADRKGTQLVFSDLSTPDGSKFNVYDDIKNKLIAKGVPMEEIAFIHDANNEKQKEELFAKVRAGKVRVLLGSTGKLGTGTNVQDKLVASHDLDVPWKPSDLEQRKGRIARQGNENEKVDVYRYVTEGTFDSYMWQILENKQRFISQVLTSKTPARITEDVDELTLSCAEVKAIASGSPLVREKLELGVEVERLKIARRGFMKDMDERKWYVEHRGKENIEAFEKRKKFAEADRDALKNYVPKQKGVIITLCGKPFTDAKEAGKAIVEAIRSGHGEELRGSYKGMAFSLHSGFDWKMELTGSLTFSEKVHMGDYAENMERLKMLEEQILQLPERIDEAIREEQRKIEETRASFGLSFPQEAEYQQKLSRLQELDVLLDEENAKDTDAIHREVQRRYDALKLVAEDGDYLEAAYAEKALKKIREGVEWSEQVDREIARELFADGFERKEIASMLIKRSPKIYDEDTAEAIAASDQKFQCKMAAFI